jgi:predicted MFS family arabinose efflux permease
MGLSPVWLAVLGAGRQLGEGQGRWMSRAYAFWLVGIGLGPITVSFCLNWPAEWGLWGLIGMWVLALVLAVATGDDRMGTGTRTPGWTKDMTQFLVKRWGILAGVVVQTAAAGMLVPVFETYAHSVLGLTNTEYGLLLLVGGAFVVALMLLIGRLVDERGPRIWLVSGFLLCGAAVAWLGAFPPMHWTTLAAVLAVLAVGYGLVMPSWNAFVASVIPEDRQATAWGVYTTAEGCGISIGPVIGGVIAGMWGLVTPFIVSGLLLAGLGVVYGIRTRRLPSRAGAADMADASDSGARR